MTNKIIPISFSCLLCCNLVAAQEGLYRYEDALQLWRLTDNAAGLGLDHSENRGYAEFSLEHAEGDYRRVQEGGQRNSLAFETERHQRIGPLLVGYGHFRFDMDRTKDRAWADVMRPYDSNPYYGGSSVSGKYDLQQFDLSAALSTIAIPLAGGNADRELTIGARLDYKVADLSRLRDPRSRSELLDYKIAPAVTYSFGNNTLGLSGHYRRRKEKIPNMTTVQQDPNLLYYQMYGLGEAVGTVGGYSGYQREWVDHQFGAEVSYSLTPKSLTPRPSPKERGVYTSSAEDSTDKSDHSPLLGRGAGGEASGGEASGGEASGGEASGGEVFGGGPLSLNSLSIARGAEDAWGQYKFSPGRYTSYIYKAATRNRLHRGRLLHSLDLEATWQQAYADEYRQQLIQEKDPDRGYTSYRYDTQITYGKRHQLSTIDASLHYRLNFLCPVCCDPVATPPQSASVASYLGFLARLSGSDTKHLLPSSELNHQRLDLSVEGGYGLLRDRLWLDAAATYSRATKARLDLADNTTEIARQVLLPDMAYYDADYFRGQLSLKYLFPLKLKGHRSLFYVKAYGDIISARHAQNRNAIGLSLGLYN